jgi:tRNA (guanine37-N1)-methyltransferase
MGLAFDIIGEIAIVEVPDGTGKKGEKEIAKRIMETNRRVKTVFRKASGRTGIYRIRKLNLIGGVNNPITIQRENGILLKLNVRKSYFSPRESTERMRIVEKINSIFSKTPAQLGMTFFAGIGATPILISKKTQTREIYGIEINPNAVKYFNENIGINKVSNVFAVSGDVMKEAKNFKGKCDFVTMPLPETGWKFLGQAMRCLNPGGICFFYAISDENDLQGKWIKKIESSARKIGRKVRILETRKVLPYASRKWKVRIDFVVN